MKRIILLALGVLALASTPALAMGDLSVMGGINRANPSGSPAYSSGTSFAFGATIGGNSNPFLNFEAGFLYMPRKFEASGAPVDLTALEFPLMLRITALPFVSFAAGGYYAHIVDHHGVDATVGSSDLGVGGSVRLRVPVAPLIGLVADVRYLIGLNNLSKLTAGDLKTRNLELLAGLSFAL